MISSSIAVVILSPLGPSVGDHASYVAIDLFPCSSRGKLRDVPTHGSPGFGVQWTSMEMGGI